MEQRRREKTLADVALDGLVKTIEEKGMDQAIYEYAQNRQFCNDTGIPYESKLIASLIRRRVAEYISQQRKYGG